MNQARQRPKPIFRLHPPARGSLRPRPRYRAERSTSSKVLSITGTLPMRCGVIAQRGRPRRRPRRHGSGAAGGRAFELPNPRIAGDFVGGGAVVFVVKTILQTSSQSPRVETAADAYGVMLMTRISGDARAWEISVANRRAPLIPDRNPLDHPETRDCVTVIEAMAGSAPTRPLLDQADWAALKSICSSS